MSPDEKQALQTILIDELASRMEQEPTLLVDVLLQGQGFQFIAHVLQRRSGMARQAVTMNEHLLRALSQAVPPPMPGPQETEAA